MSLTRSKDVPTFGPAIPEGPAFRNSAEFKEFLLTKGTIASCYYSVTCTNGVELNLSSSEISRYCNGVSSSRGLVGIGKQLRKLYVTTGGKVQIAENCVSIAGCLCLCKPYSNGFYPVNIIMHTSAVS